MDRLLVLLLLGLSATLSIVSADEDDDDGWSVWRDMYRCSCCRPADCAIDQCSDGREMKYQERFCIGPENCTGEIYRRIPCDVSLAGDITLVIDSSVRVRRADLREAQRFSRDLVNVLNFTNVQLAIINYGRGMEDTRDFYTDTTVLNAWIDSMHKIGGWRFTHRALLRARWLFKHKGNEGAKRFLILVTKGLSIGGRNTEAIANILEKKYGVTLIVYVPNSYLTTKSRDELEDVATVYDLPTFFQTDTYADLTTTGVESILEHAHLA